MRTNFILFIAVICALSCDAHKGYIWWAACLLSDNSSSSSSLLVSSFFAVDFPFRRPKNQAKSSNLRLRFLMKFPLLPPPHFGCADVRHLKPRYYYKHCFDHWTLIPKPHFFPLQFSQIDAASPQAASLPDCVAPADAVPLCDLAVPART